MAHFFFLKGIHIAWDIEVEVIQRLASGQTYPCPLCSLIGLEDLLDMGIRHDILVLALVKFLKRHPISKRPGGPVLLRMMTVVGICCVIKEDIGRRRPITINGPLLLARPCEWFHFSIAGKKGPVRRTIACFKY